MFSKLTRVEFLTTLLVAPLLIMVLPLWASAQKVVKISGLSGIRGDLHGETMATFALLTLARMMQAFVVSTSQLPTQSLLTLLANLLD
jgi:hypothetical protein